MYKLILVVLALAAIAAANPGVLRTQAIHGLTSYSHNVRTAGIGYAAAPAIGYGGLGYGGLGYGGLAGGLGYGGIIG